MCNHPTATRNQRPLPDNRSYPANGLNPQQRQRLALEALAGIQPLSRLADEHDVSRKFLYQLTGKAQQALDHAFAPKPDDQKVLFTIPVTKARLRGYFFLRRELGSGYLSLLQFFLNHRRFQRSKHAERVGKSPAELLLGQTHPHWLEMLGYQRLKRN